MSVSNLSSMAKSLEGLADNGNLMPVLFMGHGNPMNAIEDNAYTKSWAELTKTLPTPRAILCISAHWETRGTKVTAMKTPRTIYDFGGFPPELSEVKYNCPGAPALAAEVVSQIKKTRVELDHEWGLDHGTWSVLARMYPNADIPCFQMSLDRTRDLQYHYDLAKELAFLRKKGVLIIGSGNIVHNLRYAFIDPEKPPYDWAIEFDDLSTKAMDERNHQALINYQRLGKSAALSVNSAEHYIPLLYTLALQGDEEPLSYTNADFQFRAGSMRCVKIGA